MTASDGMCALTQLSAGKQASGHVGQPTGGFHDSKHACAWTMASLWAAIILTASALPPRPTLGQNARAALETYEEGPVWQIMTFRIPPANRELHLKNLATVWEHQAKLAQETGFLLDYKVLTKWPASPDDWNVMLIEIFPSMASYDDFWENWPWMTRPGMRKPSRNEWQHWNPRTPSGSGRSRSYAGGR
jgi:hypothetical protein